MPPRYGLHKEVFFLRQEMQGASCCFSRRFSKLNKVQMFATFPSQARVEEDQQARPCFLKTTRKEES
jgi:hypothetical protein